VVDWCHRLLFIFVTFQHSLKIWGIPYMIRAYKLSNTSAATYVSMIFLGWAIGGPVVGWISIQSLIAVKPVMIGSILGCIIFSGLIYFPEPFKPFLAPVLFLFGMCSSVQILIFPIAREINSQALAGTAIAVTKLLVMMGGVVSQPLIGKILDIFTENVYKN